MAEEIEKKEDIATEDDVSLRDTIEAAYEEESSKEETVSTSTEPSDKSRVEDGDRQADSSSPSRDASGKFLSKTPSADSAVDRKTPTGAQSTHAILAPKELQGEEKAKFESLPRELQEYITKKESDVGSKAQEVESKIRDYADIDRAYEPHSQKLALQGFNKGQAVNQLFALYNALETDPASAIEWLKNTYGVQGEQGYQQPQQYQQAQYQDPRLEAVTRELQQVKSYISGQQTSGLQSDYDTFRNMKDANGNLAHPYVDEIESEAAQFVPLVKQQNPNLSNVEVMKEAYERAVWSNPRTREAMQKGTVPAKQSQTSMIQRVNAAKRRAGSVTGAPRGGSEAVDSKDLSLRETIEAAYDGRLQ